MSVAKTKFKLGLELATDPRWVNIAEKSLEDILVDHAFCEQKAASTCISLIVKYSDKREVVEQVSPIVSEEWAHFRKVHSEIKKRGFDLGVKRKDDYVVELLKIQKKGGSREEGLVDKLLTSAMIEARSCERFRLLSIHIKDKYMKSFYHEFMVSEAQHYKVFLNLAKLYMNEDLVMQRWEEFIEQEAEIMKKMEPRADRMH